MRLAFRSIALFNIATSLWLTVMFLILRHANFGPRAAVAMGIAVFCGCAFYASRPTAPPWMRAAAMSGSLMLGAAGVLAIYQDLQPNASFEGFVLIIGTAWIAQATTALVTFAARSTDRVHT